MIGGCSDPSWNTPPPTPTPKYHEGDFVRSALSDQKGQVLRVNCWSGDKSCTYSVRFINPALETDTHLFTADGPTSTNILPVIDHMNEYELKPYTKK